MAKINKITPPVSGAFTALTKPITPDELAGISKPTITSGLGGITSNINLDEFEGINNNFLSGDDAKDLKALEQTRYDNQSGLGLVAKGIGNIGSTLLSEVAKMPGYLGGFATDVFSGNAFEGDFSNTIDNFWLNGVSYVKENTTDEWLKTYSNPNLTDAPLLEQLGDPAFWAKEGADGVGFLLSFLLPGQLLKSVGIGAKGAKLLAKTGVAMNFEKAAGLIDSTSAVFLNTVLESAAEGSNAYDTAIKQGKTAEEAGEIGSNIFKKNIPVLLASNFFVEKYIMSGFNRLAGKQGLSRVTGDVIDGSKDLAPLTTKQKLGRLATKAPAATLQEGLFEEGLQTTIEQKEGGNWSTIFEKYFDNLANMWNGESKDATDFGKAVVLGGLLGSVSGGISTMFEAKAEDRLLLGQDEKKANTFNKWLGIKDREQKEGLVSVFRNAYTETGVTNEELFNFDETGAITGFKPDIDKKLQTKLGVSALTNFYSDLVRQYDGNVEVAKREFINKLGEKGASLLDMLRINNDLSNYETIEQVNNRNDFDYFSRFFNLEGGKDLLDQHIDAVANKVKERYKANTGQELKQDITSEIKKKANEYFEINNKATKLATRAKYSIDSKGDPLFNEFISMYQRDLAVTLADIDNADSRIENINSKINDVKSKASTKGYTEGDINEFLSAPEKDELQRLESDKKAYEDSLKELNTHYEKLTKEPQKLYDESVAKAKSLEKKIEKEENKEAAKVADTIDKANEYSGEPVEYVAADGTIYTIEDKGDSVLVTNEAGQSKSFASFIEAERALKGGITPVAQKKQREQQVSDAQTISATEADEANYNPSDVDVSTDPFYNHAKSNNLAETTGISNAYRQDGSDQTFTTEEGNILPVPYPSKYQQAWFQYTDDTGIDKSQHKLLLVNPKYDNSSPIEVAIGEMNPMNQLSTDVFAVVINSQTKEPVRYNGELLINGVRTKDTKIPLDNTKEPAINWYSLMNSYLGVNFKTSLNRDQMNSNKKATDFPKKNEIEKVLGKKINDMTYVEVLTELKPYVRVWGNRFYDETYLQPVIRNGSMEADIAGFTNGFPIRVLDSEGNVKMFSPTETFDLNNRPYELVLSNAKGELIVNGTVQSGFKAGITYLRLIDSNQIVPLQNQMLNKDEVDLVLQVLAKVADKPNLDITISDSGIPAQGLEFMQINNINFGYGKGNTAIPLFTSAKNRFGLFSMLMNWGSKSDTLSKYEIKIDKGNVVFGDKSLPLTFIRDNINDPTKLQDLILFLRNKRFHVNNTILRSQPKTYFHPTSFKDGKIVFTKYNSYNEYVLSRLNTDVAPKSYYKKYNLPQFAQRNIIFNKPTKSESTPKEEVQELPIESNVSNQPSQVQPDVSDVKDKPEVKVRKSFRDALPKEEDDDFKLNTYFKIDVFSIAEFDEAGAINIINEAFAKVSNDEDAKKLYKQFAIKYHPDKKGSTAVMQHLNNVLDDFKRGAFSTSYNNSSNPRSKFDEEFEASFNRNYGRYDNFERPKYTPPDNSYKKRIHRYSDTDGLGNWNNPSEKLSADDIVKSMSNTGTIGNFTLATYIRFAEENPYYFDDTQRKLLKAIKNNPTFSQFNSVRIGWNNNSENPMNIDEVARISAISPYNSKNVSNQHVTISDIFLNPDIFTEEYFNKNLNQSAFKFFTDTVGHEIMHKLTLTAIFKNSSFQREIERLYSETKAQLKEAGIGNDLYAMTNSAEFIAEFFNNPDYRRILSTIYTKTDNTKSIFEKIIAFIVRLFNKQYKFKEVTVEKALRKSLKRQLSSKMNREASPYGNSIDNTIASHDYKKMFFYKNQPNKTLSTTDTLNNMIESGEIKQNCK